MSFTWWKYRRRFDAGRHRIEVVTSARMDALASELSIDDVPFAWDVTPAFGPEAVRNHMLAATLPDGRRLEVEAGYVSMWSVGIVARLEGALIHESHPGRTIAYPEKYREFTAGNRSAGEALRASARQGAGPMAGHGYDPGQLARNKVPIMVDIALGLLFFVVAKLTDLSTAALVGAGAGIALVVLQRFVKVDLLGGLAMFGIVMLLISAGLAVAFQDDAMVKMRSTIVGTISAVLFLGDGLLGGNRLGKGLTRYLPYNDIDPGRLALGMGVLGLIMAGLNYAVARLASTDVWLFYTTFVDFFLVMLMILLVFSFARGRLIPPRTKTGER
ncbi:MAG TPA: septation protein IspZ [Croceibacterium sp.]